MAVERNITVIFKEYGTPGELSADDREIINSAKEASRNAYAPYSGFHVGAAVRLESGEIVLGSNVENAAFPSGICAERAVLSSVNSVYPGKKAVDLAVAARTEAGYTEYPVTPCGNCRQVMAEEELRNGMPIRLILYGEKKIVVVENAGALLPLQFNKNLLTRFHP
ncbi:MAG: cytidine deaminase [Bacteroidales bacterium]|jgi:cytidine deaminase|nr:cytidine deaminase [Bacteroidales bacterium]